MRRDAIPLDYYHNAVIVFHKIQIAGHEIANYATENATLFLIQNRKRRIPGIILSIEGGEGYIVRLVISKNVYPNSNLNKIKMIDVFVQASQCASDGNYREDDKILLKIDWKEGKEQREKGRGFEGESTGINIPVYTTWEDCKYYSLTKTGLEIRN